MAVITGDGGNNTLYGTTGLDTIYGLDGNDALIGFESDDILVGGTGADYLSGGGSVGGDFASYSTAASGVVADFRFPQFNTGDAAGDTYFQVEHLIGSDFDDALSGDNDPNIINAGSGNDFLAGHGGDDQLFAGLGDDRMMGGEGADKFFGGVGSDVVDYSTATAGVVADLGGGGNSGEALGDTYFDCEALYGSQFSDGLLGDDEGNVLAGLGGHDVVDGYGGNDTIYGDAGNDTLQGGAGNDRILGGEGADKLSGDLGADHLSGQAGNDLYYVDDAGDLVDESLAGSDGKDQVSASISFSLANPLASLGAVEDLFLTGSAELNGTGNSLDNLILGNDGRNVLNGGLGADQLIAFGGNDLLIGGSGIDALRGGFGNDTYIVDAANEANETDGGGIDTVRSIVSYGLGADLENLYLLGTAHINGAGNALGNRMIGSAGNNVLIGRLGRDVMTGDLFTDMGGPGRDRFVFYTLAESGVTSATRDIITDFNAGTSASTLDRIDVSPIDANVLAAGNQAFIYGGAFVAGHIRAVEIGTNVVLEFNTDGDSAAEMTIQLNNVLAGNLNAGDFVL